MRTLPVLLLLLACGSQRRGEPLVGPLPLSGEAVRGREVFMANCHSCHPGGEAGLGPTITASPSPVWLQRQQVRLGAGAMPAFGKSEISPEDLDAMASFLRALRHHRPSKVQRGQEVTAAPGAAR